MDVATSPKKEYVATSIALSLGFTWLTRLAVRMVAAGGRGRGDRGRAGAATAGGRDGAPG